MSGFLFEQIVFGPIRSRRLGISLGVNLLPLNRKVCTYNCVYCECGWTLASNQQNILPDSNTVKLALETRLKALAEKNAIISSITFAGNGEPTLHPEFGNIIDSTIEIRNALYPEAKITVLSNGTQLERPEVASALRKVDQNILKLDAGSEHTYQILNQPGINFTLEHLVRLLKQFSGNLIIQSMFVRGAYNGASYDNTTDDEVQQWLQHLQYIRPQKVLIYPIARETPAGDSQKISFEILEQIARKVEACGINAEVYY